MTTRRGFKSCWAPGRRWSRPTWADMGGPRLSLPPPRRPDGNFALFGIDETGTISSRCPLPDRPIPPPTRILPGDGGVCRPGRYAVLFDCGSGAVSTLTPPDGLVFCGHGAYDPPGARFLPARPRPRPAPAAFDLETPRMAGDGSACRFGRHRPA